MRPGPLSKEYQGYNGKTLHWYEKRTEMRAESKEESREESRVKSVSSGKRGKRGERREKCGSESTNSTNARGPVAWGKKRRGRRRAREGEGGGIYSFVWRGVPAARCSGRWHKDCQKRKCIWAKGCNITQLGREDWFVEEQPDPYDEAEEEDGRVLRLILESAFDMTV